MKWPVGKYNGQRIVGFSVKFEVDVISWVWKPRIEWKYFLCVSWMCFYLWVQEEYEGPSKKLRREGNL